MGEIVSHSGRGRPTRAYRKDDGEGALYGRSPAERKYLNAEERGRVLRAASTLPADKAFFALTLAWTGARASEVLALCPMSFQIEPCKVTVRTLKRRRPSMREIPIPPALMEELDHHFQIRAAQCEPRLAEQPLWSWSRQTGWRVVKRLMLDVGVSGRRASPRGFRHAFAIGTLQAGVPLNLVQRWLGHASMATTAIYADVSGPEELAFAERFWRFRSEGRDAQTLRCP